MMRKNIFMGILVYFLILTGISPGFAWWWEKTSEQKQYAEKEQQQAAATNQQQLCESGSSIKQPIQQQQMHEGQIGDVPDAARTSAMLPETPNHAFQSLRETEASPLPSSSQTTIMIFQPPTPLPKVEPQDSQIHTIINGIDQIETKAILPEHLGVDQLEAMKKIADNGTMIAQQRLAVEQYRIDSTSKVEWLRLSKGFVLWGLLLSIPFLITISWIARNVLRGWRDWQRDRLTYKLQELESLERQIMMSENHSKSQ